MKDEDKKTSRKVARYRWWKDQASKQIHAISLFLHNSLPPDSVFLIYFFTLPAQTDQYERRSVMIGEIWCVIQAKQSGENIKIAEMRKERESFKENKKKEQRLLEREKETGLIWLSSSWSREK